MDDQTQGSVDATARAESGNDTGRIIHDAILGWLKRQPGNDIESIDYDDSLFELGVDSLGVAEIRAGETSGDWLLRADEALYQAKRAGRNITKRSA